MGTRHMPRLFRQKLTALQMVIAAWIIFTGFSLGCGLAATLEQLIAFRALQGVGGSGLYSLCNVCTCHVLVPWPGSML